MARIEQEVPSPYHDPNRQLINEIKRLRARLERTQKAMASLIGDVGAHGDEYASGSVWERLEQAQTEAEHAHKAWLRVSDELDTALSENTFLREGLVRIKNEHVVNAEDAEAYFHYVAEYYLFPERFKGDGPCGGTG